MARLFAAITRVLSLDEYREPEVHFHAHGQDQPEICYDQRCSRPRFSA